MVSVGPTSRETQPLASLNHPNVAVIYDLEESEGVRFLILELVEGENLADRLTKMPLPVDEVLEIGRGLGKNGLNRSQTRPCIKGVSTVVREKSSTPEPRTYPWG